MSSSKAAKLSQGPFDNAQAIAEYAILPINCQQNLHAFPYIVCYHLMNKII